MNNTSKIFDAIRKCSFNELLHFADYIKTAWDERGCDDTVLEYASALADYAEAWFEDNPEEEKEYITYRGMDTD